MASRHTPRVFVYAPRAYASHRENVAGKTRHHPKNRVNTYS